MGQVWSNSTPQPPFLCLGCDPQPRAREGLASGCFVLRTKLCCVAHVRTRFGRAAVAELYGWEGVHIVGFLLDTFGQQLLANAPHALLGSRKVSSLFLLWQSLSKVNESSLGSATTFLIHNSLKLGM